MKKYRVLVVDDSPFGQRIVENALMNSEFEICGFAGDGLEGIEKYAKLQPDIVTMDITMPGMDGINCSRELVSRWEDAKIVMVSSMKDDSLILQGKANGIRAFVQKPVDGGELLAVLTSLVQPVTQESFLGQYADKYAKSLTEVLKQLGIQTQAVSIDDNPLPFVVNGIGIVIGITGAYQGRLILDMDLATAVAFAKTSMAQMEVTQSDIQYSVSELANIIAGNGTSKLNRQFEGLDLRVTPPSILVGESISVISPKLKMASVTAETTLGLMMINVGFTGGRRIGR